MDKSIATYHVREAEDASGKTTDRLGGGLIECMREVTDMQEFTATIQESSRPSETRTSPHLRGDNLEHLWRIELKNVTDGTFSFRS